MTDLTITVYGQPAPQGSKKFLGRPQGTHGIMVESSKKVKPWREAVKSAAFEAMGGNCQGISGPVTVEMTFTIRKPKSAPKKRRTWPDRKPDLSKLVRSTEDALTDIGAWEDDARVVSCTARKVFPREHRFALPVSGAFIRIQSAELCLSHPLLA